MENNKYSPTEYTKSVYDDSMIEEITKKINRIVSLISGCSHQSETYLIPKYRIKNRLNLE